MQIFRTIAVLASLGLVLGFISAAEPALASTQRSAARASDERRLATLIPAARDLPTDGAAAATSAQQQAAASVWTPPAAPVAPPDGLIVSPSKPFAPSITTGAGDRTGSLQTFAVGAVTVGVDRSTGELSLGDSDLAVAGAATSVTFDRVFGSNSRERSRLGGGWTSSLETGLWVEGANLVLYTELGDRSVFEGDGVGGFRPSGGLTMTRVSESPERTFRTTDDAGNAVYYSENGYRTAELDRLGRGVVYRYLDDGRPAIVQDPVTGRFIAFDYVDNTLADAYDSAGRRVAYEHDDSGRVTKITAVDGSETILGYDGSGNLVDVGASSAATESGIAHITVSYDGKGRVATVSRETEQSNGTHDPAVTKFGYSGETTVVTDALGNSTSYSFDDRGNTTAVTDAAGARLTATWSGGQPDSVTDAAGAVLKLSHDAGGNAIGSQLPTGATSAVEFDSSNGCGGIGGSPEDPNCLVDASGNRTAVDYDGSNDPIAVIDSLGTAAQLAYSARGDPASCSTVPGQVCLSVDGNGVATSYRYDANGALVERGVMTTPGQPLIDYNTYGHDSIGRLTAIGHAERSNLPPSSLTTLEYDNRDEVVHLTVANATGFTTSENWIGYDADGRQSFSLIDARYLQRNTYDRRGYLTRESSLDAHTGVESSVYRYVYDAEGHVTWMISAPGSTRYTYTARGQLASIQEPDGDCARGVHCTTFDYDANGNETARHFVGIGNVASSYDASQRLTERVATDSDGADKTHLTYSYANAAGQDTGLIQSTGIAEPLRYRSLPSGEKAPIYTTTNYGYDARGRLTSAVETSPLPYFFTPQILASWSYSYDGAGNRVSQTRSGNTGQATSVDTPPSTITYSYDQLNRIVGTSADTSGWMYDADGNQLRNGMTAVLTPEGEASSSGASTEDADFVIATPDGEPIGHRDATGSHYFVKDATGSVVAIFGPQGSRGTTFEGSYSYSPFGELRNASAAPANNRFRFAGAIAVPLATDIHVVGVRTYDASLGRFLQSDPDSPGTASYGYAGQDPVNHVDRSGFDWLAAIGSGIIATASAFMNAAACSVHGSARLCAQVGTWGAVLTAGLTAGVTWARFGTGWVNFLVDTVVYAGFNSFRFLVLRLSAHFEAREAADQFAEQTERSEIRHAQKIEAITRRYERQVEDLNAQLAAERSARERAEKQSYGVILYAFWTLAHVLTQNNFANPQGGSR